MRAAEQLCVTPNKIHPMSYIIKLMTKFKDDMGHSLCPILWPMSGTGFVEMLSMDFYDLGHKMSKSLETWGLRAQVQALVAQSIPPAGVSLTSTMTHEQFLSACSVADPGLWPPYRGHNRLNQHIFYIGSGSKEYMCVNRELSPDSAVPLRSIKLFID